MPRSVARIATLAVLVVLPACGVGHHTAATTSTAAVPSTATTVTGDSYAPPPGSSPLTGLPISGAAATRPALVVKIDNAPKARPQTGLNQADFVVEEKVEDGVTRFFTVFHSADVVHVGPVRSARSTDISIAGALNRPLFAYSGTNPTFQKLVDTAPLVDVGIDHATAEYRRDGSRPAPYNLFSDTAALWRHAPAGATAPPPQFRFRFGGEPSSAAGAGAVGGAHLSFVGVHVTTTVDWAWDAASHAFRRRLDGVPHVDSAGQQVAAQNVIVQFVDYVDTGIRDRSNSPVPEAQLIGSGEAWVLTDGKVVKGTWTKPALASVTVFAAADGRQIRLTPGHTWIELSPKGATTLT